MELFHSHLFVTVVNVVDSNRIFFVLAECHLLFSMCRLPRISFSLPVELSHLILVTVTQCSFINYKPPYFLLFHTYSSFVWTAKLFCLFFWVELSHFSLSKCHANILCVSIIMGVNVTHARLNFLCVNVTQISLPFHSLLSVSFYVITDPFLFLSCVDCHTSFFLDKKSTCPTSFLGFGNMAKLFITTFIFQM